MSLRKLWWSSGIRKGYYYRRNLYSHSSSYVSQSNHYAPAVFSFNSFKYHYSPFLSFRGQGRNMYIPATPSLLSPKDNPENTLQDRVAHPAINAPTTIAFHGNFETQSKVEEAGHGHNIMMQTTKHDEKMDWSKVIKIGDVININDLLFTKNRDYLIRHNDDRLVKAEDLANKLIVIYLVGIPAGSLRERMATTHLVDAYNYLLPLNVFEVVLVAYETDEILHRGSNIDPEKQFEAMFSQFEATFSCMPWTAIPFSDVTSRECLRRRFGMHRFETAPETWVIDSTGMVLEDRNLYLFEKYGGLAYPFNEERIQYLESQDAALAERPSLKKLLASPERDYVITKKGDKVPIDTLEGKVVALYFYEEGRAHSRLTADIEFAYEEFAQKKKEFEVVLIYLYDTESTCGYTNEETFWNAFKSMPWLALPFRDPSYFKLKRFFGHNLDHGDHGIIETPSLVIFGPHGRFIEPWAADILKKFKLPAYPFTREKVAKLEAEKMKELKLEMLWDRNTFFRRNDATEIPLYELAGKRIIHFFEGYNYSVHVADFLDVLKISYARMKGTHNEFEVIYITSSKEATYEEMVFDVPWLFALESEVLPIGLGLYCSYCSSMESRCSYLGWCGKICTVLVFDRDGKLVGKSTNPRVSSYIEFPFCDADMVKEALYKVGIHHRWEDLDQQYRGLVIN